MIRHDFYSFDGPTVLLTNLLKDFYNVFVVNENSFAIFGTPHKVKIDIANRVIISDIIRQNNKLHYFDYIVI